MWLRQALASAHKMPELGLGELTMDTGDKKNKQNSPFGFTCKLFFGLAVICAVPVGSVVTATADTAIVTNQGPLKGIVTPQVNEYLGIPYAAPPVGDLRWLPPQRPASFNGLFQATQFGNACPQSDGVGGVFGDENCLFLNVYVPNVSQDQQPAHGFSVMVWIHGGGLVNGAGSLYDPTPLVVKGGLIVVTINYRLGFLGFFAHPALDAEGHLNANYGYMDQQFALNWVQRNIGAFGGNRNRVTIFGESAGGESVYSQLASPLAAGLFQRAISESGAYAFPDFVQSIVSLSQSEQAGKALVASLGSCPNQTSLCLRSLAIKDLVNAEPFPVEPIIDGTLLTQHPRDAFASGDFNKVPVISGSNHDEYRLFVAIAYDYQGHPLVTETDYDTAVNALWGPFFAPIILSLYPFSSSTSPGITLGASVTDAFFSCTARRADESLSKYIQTYTYEFNDENAPLNLGLVPASFPLGAYHSAEIQYLLNIFGTPATFTPDQQRLSDAMIGYWTQFAKTGNPNEDGLPNWPLYARQGVQADEFQSLVPPTPAIESSFSGNHQCSSLWDGI
jgi:para-nitrobenzyl esterase